jgi:hypothetical protein
MTPVKMSVQERVRARALFYLSEETTVAELTRYIELLKARQSYLVQLTRRILNHITAPNQRGYDSRRNQDVRADAMLLVHGVGPADDTSDPEVAAQVGEMGLAVIDRALAKLTLRRDRLTAGLEALDRLWPNGVPPLPGGNRPTPDERMAQGDAELRAYLDSHARTG